MKPGKRGQVTTFAIIGIVIVAAVLSVIYINRASLSSILKQGEIESITVPEKLNPLKEAIETCLKDTITEGISLLSLQGGYIKIEEDILPRGPVNQFSNSLNILGNNMPVAYWFYEKANGVKTLKVPTMESMQKQLENYVDVNSKLCLDLSNFKSEGFAFNEGNVVADVEINDNTVEVAVNYPLTVYARGLQFNFERFKFNLRSNLGLLYNSAIEVLEAENNYLYLENKTLDFMSVYDQVPYLDLDLDCTPKTYLKKNIENNLRDILATNIPYIKVKGNQILDRSLFFSQAEVDDVEVNFNYNPEWPMQFDVISNPNDQVLRGEPYSTENKMSQFIIPLFCLNTYNFVYNIKYPVLITLNAGSDIFQFATQVIIDHNQPRNADIVSDIELFEESPICDNAVTPMTVNTLADLDGNFVPLNDVKVSLQCVDASCKLGNSNQQGNLKTISPACMNGILTAERQDYHKATQTLSTITSSEVSIVLEPYYELEVDVKVMDDNARSLRSNEQAMIQLENREKQYSTAIISPGFDKVKLIQGTYHVNSYLMLNSSTGIAINDQTIEVCNDMPSEGFLGALGMTEKKCTKQKVEGTVLYQVLSGGNEFDFDVSSLDLKNKKIIFYVKSVDVPTNYNQLTKINQKIKKNDVITPVFTNE